MCSDFYVMPSHHGYHPCIVSPPSVENTLQFVDMFNLAVINGILLHIIIMLQNNLLIIMFSTDQRLF